MGFNLVWEYFVSIIFSFWLLFAMLERGNFWVNFSVLPLRVGIKIVKFTFYVVMGY